MNALTRASIHSIGIQLNPTKPLDQTTIAYIRTLLQPYAEAIDQAQTIDAIRDWIPQAFPGQLAKQAGYILDRDYRPGNINTGKDAIIKYLVTKIVQLAVNATNDINDVTILPWDVQRAVAFNPELSTLVGIRNDPQTLRNGEPQLLPVVINGYTHYFSQDFVAGLLLFSLKAGQDFRPTMFGAPLSPFYMTQENRYKTDDFANYKLVLSRNDDDYRFNSPDFMQGFATGAEWAGVDHHDYWTALYQVAENGNEIPITF